MLSKRPVQGAGLVCIGKEAHRLEERDLVSGLDDIQGIYRDPRRAPWEQVTREDAETVAESSASVVLAHYGVDAGSYSFPYVARWAEDKAVLRRNLAEVQGVAARLIKGIDAAG